MNTYAYVYFQVLLTISGIGHFVEVWRSEQLPPKSRLIPGEQRKADS